MSNMGKNIKEYRVAKNMTQDDLALKLNVSRKTISSYETGRSEPDIETLAKLAEIFQVDVNVIIYGPEFSGAEGSASVLAEDKGPYMGHLSLKKTVVLASIFTVFTAVSIFIFGVIANSDSPYWRIEYFQVEFYAKIVGCCLLIPIACIIGGRLLAAIFGKVFKIKRDLGKASRWIGYVCWIFIGLQLFCVSEYLLVSIIGLIDYFIDIVGDDFNGFENYPNILRLIGDGRISYYVYLVIFSEKKLPFVMAGFLLGIRR